jgi:hypothetical protein
MERTRDLTGDQNFQWNMTGSAVANQARARTATSGRSSIERRHWTLVWRRIRIPKPRNARALRCLDALHALMPCFEQAQMNDVRVALNALAQDQPMPNQPIEQGQRLWWELRRGAGRRRGLCGLDGRR